MLLPAIISAIYVFFAGAYCGNNIQVRPMEEKIPTEGSSSRDTVYGESSGANLELNVRTLDSRIFHFQVDKNVSKNKLFTASHSHLKG